MKQSEFDRLKNSIYYMNLEELKDVCLAFNLPGSGKKGELIERILHFVQHGKILREKEMPEESKAQKNKRYPLASNTLILHGSYKNDRNTREFFKKLLGEHFHFTAFGQDWIKARWSAGDPPTYAEFAAFWQKEYLSRQRKKTTPKREWAYLNFIQSFLKQHPTASKKQITSAWEKIRTEKAREARKLLKLFF